MLLQRHAKKIIVFLITLLVTTIAAFIWITSRRQPVLGIVSPLSDETKLKAEEYRVIFDKKTTQNYPPNHFFPPSLTPKFNDELNIAAKAYAVMDRQTGELLLARSITQELPIASLTKIMTAVVALEQADLNLELQVSSAAASIGEASMGLTPGESVTVEELLYGMMLPSGNDAAEVLAAGLGTGRDAFITSMNHKAQDLGMFDTYFYNPTGLDEETREKSNFSTTLDLLGLTNYALTNPKFAEIVASHYKEFPYVVDKHKAFYLGNILQLDWSYPGIKGVKPGVTDFAGETLVSYAENGGRQLILVLLGTPYSKDEAVKVYDYIFPKLGLKVH